MKTSDKILVSICMPTFNRASFIGQALESVISQADNNIEIVIVDGASTDNTAQVVQQYQKKFGNLVYYRGEKNLGVNRDMAKTIELARGQYCWMLSDDDSLKPGAIKRILEEIKTGCQIYLCNITVCNLSMQPIRERFWLSAKVKDRIFNLNDKDEFIEYCNKADSIGALFSYMSSIILHRPSWMETGYHYDFDDTAYALASSLLSFTRHNCKLKYIRDSLVFWREDNASFQFADGPVKRFLLDFDGYLKLADKYLSEDHKAKKAFFRVMRREHPWYTIINVTSFINDSKVWEQFKNKMLKFGYHSLMINFFYFLSRYKNFIAFAVAIKRKIIKNRRIQAVMDWLLGRKKYFKVG
ncbi:MAG: glycosyltransferase family 2 protein [Candidatus Omnitrophica bacterium]|jgi:abequosyltransferase|nr:glycosyltransferase family 2 protein [Candidatus Omnitrophota bacterium]